MSKEVKLKFHEVKSCIFWSEGCKCNSAVQTEVFGKIWCSGRDNCSSYEYLQPWARHLHKLGKRIHSKKEGYLEATWIKHEKEKE
jgi:hypothetical protein